MIAAGTGQQKDTAKWVPVEEKHGAARDRPCTKATKILNTVIPCSLGRFFLIFTSSPLKHTQNKFLKTEHILSVCKGTVIVRMTERPRGLAE